MMVPVIVVAVSVVMFVRCHAPIMPWLS